VAYTVERFAPRCLRAKIFPAVTMCACLSDNETAAFVERTLRTREPRPWPLEGLAVLWVDGETAADDSVGSDQW